MDPRNVATGFEIRDLRIVISQQDDTKWFSAVVDDEREFDGTQWGAKDIRWTGVKVSGGFVSSTCQKPLI
ncbi:MAG: hypothetical protein ACFFEJ_19460 [Candidatus Thorarchaeota archaeon]